MHQVLCQQRLTQVPVGHDKHSEKTGAAMGKKRGILNHAHSGYE